MSSLIPSSTKAIEIKQLYSVGSSLVEVCSRILLNKITGAIIKVPSMKAMRRALIGSFSNLSERMTYKHMTKPGRTANMYCMIVIYGVR